MVSANNPGVPIDGSKLQDSYQCLVGSNEAKKDTEDRALSTTSDVSSSSASSFGEENSFVDEELMSAMVLPLEEYLSTNQSLVMELKRLQSAHSELIEQHKICEDNLTKQEHANVLLTNELDSLYTSEVKYHATLAWFKALKTNPDKTKAINLVMALMEEALKRRRVFGEIYLSRGEVQLGNYLKKSAKDLDDRERLVETIIQARKVALSNVTNKS